MTAPRRLAALAAVLLALAGCSSLRRVPIAAAPEGAIKYLDRPAGLRIVGYSTADGVFHGFRGTARWVGSDSLELRGRRTRSVPGAEPSGEPATDSTLTLRFPRGEVTTLVYREGDGSKSGLLVLGLLTLALVALYAFFIIALASLY